MSGVGLVERAGGRREQDGITAGWLGTLLASAGLQPQIPFGNDKDKEARETTANGSAGASYVG